MAKGDDFIIYSVTGKNIMITGGTTGIGRATAILLAGLGANVMVFGRSADHLKEAISDIRKNARGTVHGFVADIATKAGIKKIFREADKNFVKLDTLVNNAGLPYTSVTEGTYEEWDKVLKTNLLGYMACAGEAIKRMKPAKSGHIINIGSMSADVQEASSAVYVATKSGVRGFSVSLRKEVNPLGIKVSLIEPGAVDTDMPDESTETKKEKVENKTMLSADDIAMAVVYCLSQPERCDIAELKIKPHLQII